MPGITRGPNFVEKRRGRTLYVLVSVTTDELALMSSEEVNRIAEVWPHEKKTNYPCLKNVVSRASNSSGYRQTPPVFITPGQNA